ncbi:DEAD/DEAH box helicase family protein [Streptomyces sp. NPDC057651]|uniref:DEAD/DEAH box helicase family protein n=1 Tax=Streptomyces sp. NPDC057651 TaxID=3346194 RepID=UPI0036B8712A
MEKKTLRPHQREAVDAIVMALELPARSFVPERGLRTQVIMATGSGKTLVAAHSAQELHAGRVLVLVPSLDLLAQTEAAWREGGRTGPMIGVSSLRGDEVVFPNTTDADELVAWVKPFDHVTVFATYASLGLGTLERAHTAGLTGWDLIVVDEAHRVSGRIGKPWAVVQCTSGHRPSVPQSWAAPPLMDARPILHPPPGAELAPASEPLHSTR